MRQIFLDTETTGLSPALGHRVIEIAAVEVVSRRLTQRHYHVYLKPDCEIDPAAQEVHGITLDFLQDKPVFADIVDEFLAFIAGAELIIHNAPFDEGFLNSELAKIEYQALATYCNRITDTLKMAKDMRPGQRNSLDALCKHFGVDNSKRVLHGALLDAELLADVYMAMTRGQDSLMMDLEDRDSAHSMGQESSRTKPLRILQADEAELAAHKAYLEGLAKSGKCVWQDS